MIAPSTVWRRTRSRCRARPVPDRRPLFRGGAAPAWPRDRTSVPPRRATWPIRSGPTAMPARNCAPGSRRCCSGTSWAWSPPRPARRLCRNWIGSPGGPAGDFPGGGQMPKRSRARARFAQERARQTIGKTMVTTAARRSRAPLGARKRRLEQVNVAAAGNDPGDTSRDDSQRTIEPTSPFPTPRRTTPRRWGRSGTARQRPGTYRPAWNWRRSSPGCRRKVRSTSPSMPIRAPTFAQALREAGLQLDGAPQMDGGCTASPWRGITAGSAAAPMSGISTASPPGSSRTSGPASGDDWKATGQAVALGAQRSRPDGGRGRAEAARAGAPSASGRTSARRRRSTPSGPPRRLVEAHPYFAEKRVASHGLRQGEDGRLLGAGAGRRRKLGASSTSMRTARSSFKRRAG